MNRIRGAAIAYLVLAISQAVPGKCTEFVFDDGAVHTIDYVLDFSAVTVRGEGTTLNIVSGGAVTHQLFAWDKSVVNLAGGTLQAFEMLDDSRATISSGRINGYLWLVYGGQATISGGDIYGGVLNEEGQLTVSNGNLHGDLCASGCKGLTTFSGGSVDGDFEVFGCATMSGGRVGGDLMVNGALTMSGGIVDGCAHVHDEGILEISGGVIRGFLGVSQAQVIMSDGLVMGYLAVNQGTAEIRGGKIEGDFSLGTATSSFDRGILLYAWGFTINGVPASGVYTYSDYPSGGHLTGVWPNGDPLDAHFSFDEGGRDCPLPLTLMGSPAEGEFLTISAGAGGYVSEPGEGTFTYDTITTVPVVACAYTGYRFSGWTGTAVEADKVADPASASTTVTVDGPYTLQANFVPSGQFSVKVLAPNGGETLLAGGTFAIHWQTQGEIANLSIDLTVDGGSTWTHVGSPSASAGSYDWSVPKTDSDRCLVRICVLDNGVISDVSDAFFRIHKPAGHIWYVDATAAPGGDGTSWETAFACLHDGLAHAADGDSVWVAEGMYWPDWGGGQATGDRAATFRLKSGVAVYGGFPAGGGLWEQRNPFVHQSILSGAIGEPNMAADNSYHVVTGNGTDKTAILDGCIITGGFADGAEPQDRGAGLYNLRGSPQVHNCIFVSNAAAGDGGGAWNSESNATFINCVFNGNTAGNNGGGLYCEQGDVTITNCTFAANEALWRAGGVFNASGTAEVVNGILWGNSRMGGVSYDELAQVSGDPKPTLNYCCVQGWTGSLGGQNNFGRDPLFVDIDGLDDVVGTTDDDLRLQAGSPCIDKGDDAAVPPEVVADQQGDPRIINDAVDMGAYEFGAMPAPSETGGP